MALYDIVSPPGYSPSGAAMARGNGGTIEDAVGARTIGVLTLSVPAAADVKSGVQYGHQGTELTGSYVGGGGGGAGHPIIGGSIVRRA